MACGVTETLAALGNPLAKALFAPDRESCCCVCVLWPPCAGMSVHGLSFVMVLFMYLLFA